MVLCLKGGALFGSTIIAAALLEIYVRGLVLHYAQVAQAKYARRINPERELEGMCQKKLTALFGDLVNNSSGLFDKEDFEKETNIHLALEVKCAATILESHHGREVDGAGKQFP